MATQQMTEMRIELGKVFERFGIPEIHATGAAHKIPAVNIEPVLNGLKNHLPPPKLAEVGAVPTAAPEKTEKGLWDPSKGNRQNVAMVVGDGDWVKVKFTSVKPPKGNETRTKFEGDCEYKEKPYAFFTSEDPNFPEGKELIDYLVQNLAIGDPKEFVGKEVMAQYIHKSDKLGKKVARFMTIAEYEKFAPTGT